MGYVTQAVGAAIQVASIIAFMFGLFALGTDFRTLCLIGGGIGLVIGTCINNAGGREVRLAEIAEAERRSRQRNDAEPR